MTLHTDPTAGRGRGAPGADRGHRRTRFRAGARRLRQQQLQLELEHGLELAARARRAVPASGGVATATSQLRRSMPPPTKITISTPLKSAPPRARSS